MTRDRVSYDKILKVISDAWTNPAMQLAFWQLNRALPRRRVRVRIYRMTPSKTVHYLRQVTVDAVAGGIDYQRDIAQCGPKDRLLLKFQEL
jgi:hypothetical protein